MQWEYAIDAGSEEIRLVTRTQNEIIREAALAASDQKRGVFAWGEKARAIYGREPEGVVVKKLVSGGVVQDTRLLAKRIYTLTDSPDKRRLSHPGVLISVSSAMREDRRDELERRIIDAGIPVVGLIRSDFACAIGAGLEILESEAKMIVDVGAEKISASIISAGRLIASDCLPFGMQRADERIQSSLRAQYGYAVGPHTTKEIRHELGAISGMSDDVKTLKPVFDYECFMPRMREIPAKAVYPYVFEIVQALADMLERMLLFLPPEIAADLMKSGLTLAGGGAQIFGLAMHLENALGIPAKLAKESDLCVSKGLQVILKNQKAFTHLIEDEMEESLRP